VGNGGRWQVTGLDNVHADIFNDRVDLFPQKLRRHEMDVVDPFGVLRRQGRRGRHGVAAMGGDHLLIRFEATMRALYKSLIQEH